MEKPEKIKWNRISSLTREAKVFAGGSLVTRENRQVFASLPETPLFIIFYEGSEKTLSVRAVRAGRHSNEYFNLLTPYAFILGSFSQIIIALKYLWRPAYRTSLIAALIALFTPLLPWIPPGILFTIIYRRLWIQARIYRANRDMIRYSLGDSGEFAADSYLKLPIDQRSLVRRHNIKAYMLNIISWILLLCGIGVNVFFISLIISLL